MIRVRLYTTAGCHLCEQAASLLAAMAAEGGIEVIEREIAGSATLLERYGDRIPVVSLEGGDAELGWPFDGESLRRFLDPRGGVWLEQV
ncbi:MAG: glutaredoxin family protein [Gammaproteobacteria bacterium]|nr:glutaredoxin family protein [Gammaproteobacteria bacterium]